MLCCPYRRRDNQSTELPAGHGLGTGNWVCGLFRILPPFLSFHWAIPPPLTPPHSLGTEDARGKDIPISTFTLKARKLRLRGGAFPETLLSLETQVRN